MLSDDDRRNFDEACFRARTDLVDDVVWVPHATLLAVRSEVEAADNARSEHWAKAYVLAGFPMFFAGLLLGGLVVQGFREQDERFDAHKAPAAAASKAR